MASNIVPSYFKDLANSQSIQFLIDSAAKNLEKQSVWRQWLNVGLPQVSLTFEAAIGRDRIAAAASIVDADSPAPLRSRNSVEVYKGTIPTIKEKFKMKQSDMRTIESLRSLPNGAGDALVSFLDKDLQEAAVSGDKRIDYMLMQALSTLTIDVTTTNNPDGVVYGTIDLLAKSYQKQGVPTVWSTANSATPIDDIENFVNTNWNNRGRQFGRILMSYELWLKFKATTQVKNYLATFYNTGKTTSSFAVTVDSVNEMFAANMWPMIEIVNHNTVIETDGAPSYKKGFDTNACVFIPSGKIGVLYNAVSMEDMHRVAGKAYAKFGPTLVSKWAESDPLTEWTAMEMNAFPSIDIDSVYVLDTNTVKASFD